MESVGYCGKMEYSLIDSGLATSLSPMMLLASARAAHEDHHKTEQGLKDISEQLADSLKAILIDLHAVLDAEDDCINSTCIAARKILQKYQKISSI